MITKNTANLLALCYYGLGVRTMGERGKSCGRLSTLNFAESGGLVHPGTHQLTDTGLGVLREYCQKARQ